MRPTQILRMRIRRMELTTKRARKGYYKGSGTKQMGDWDPLQPNRFRVDWKKVRTFVTPDENVSMNRVNTNLTPFIAETIAKYDNPDGHQTVWEARAEKYTGVEYLQQWKEAWNAENEEFKEVEEMRRDDNEKRLKEYERYQRRLKEYEDSLTEEQRAEYEREKREKREHAEQMEKA
ncbi:hypothetical protein M011DRAFT_470256 [Sporormia fimetaria CBS 119925]|uniref:Uncharacterized protein n=1 Tax=Sporormia fimetaria CBS 119925 TaxID=1340428 RepID=A0A6A6V4F2_9PLEO|nr:hypothetical protein M011DRAFT_470256 [Sporormia fimetaria CBS 119925]